MPTRVALFYRYAPLTEFEDLRSKIRTPRQRAYGLKREKT